MATFQSPRGTKDILPEQQVVWQRLLEIASETATQMGYAPITIPTYEETALFQRSIGNGTDIIDKELFMVGSKHESDKLYSLRPEGTAGIVRAFIEHGMHTLPQPVKLYTVLTVFRYERPQKGRFREHTQLDIEYFGDHSPFADAWVIYTQWCFLRKTGLENLTVHLNSLGTAEERAAYVSLIKEQLQPVADKLSPDSQRRLDINPLRILDSKDPGDQALLTGLPTLLETLTPESLAHFQAVQHYVEAWNIPVTLDSHLVRGFDYYAHTVFEWKTTTSTGQQNSLCGGGRYDGLLPQLGGPDVGAVGGGIGLERIAEALSKQGTHLAPTIQPLLYMIAADEIGGQAALPVIDQLLQAGYQLDLDFSRQGVGNQLKVANKRGATLALILGSNEVERGILMTKNLATGEQEEIALTNLIPSLQVLL